MVETSICRLLYWAINLKRDREHHPRPPCRLELGTPIDRGGGGMERGKERERRKCKPRMSTGKERGERTRGENEGGERRETGRKRAGKEKSDRQKGWEGHLHAHLVP